MGTALAPERALGVFAETSKHLLIFRAMESAETSLGISRVPRDLSTTGPVQRDYAESQVLGDRHGPAQVVEEPVSGQRKSFAASPQADDARMDDSGTEPTDNRVAGC